MLQKTVCEGVEYSVVEFDGVRQVYAVAVPSSATPLMSQIEDALQALKTVFQREGVLGSIVMQTVFLENSGNQAACRRMMQEFYGQDLPATAYISQPPCGGNHVAIEVWGIASGKGEVEIERFGEDMVLARHEGITCAYLADIRPEPSTELVYDRSLSAFHSAGVRLRDAGLRFENVFRTWLYLGDITAAERQTTRYLELNRARTNYYRDKKFAADRVPREWNRPVFPASTGIGTADRDLAIGCIAIKTERPDVVLFPLENPQQTAAYDYAHQYGPESPKFARAMAVAAGKSVATFISGTASITASDTRYADNFERQTQQTLDNIEVLISRENFQQHGFSGMGATLDDLALARVYLKRPEDYLQARAICQKRLGNLPAIYVVGDICRSELLVEIEGIAFSRRN
jgi:enamine deaminase RidA (YjgF/YER057c/UK114 family)